MEYHIISLGAGTQSTLLYLLACNGELYNYVRTKDKWGRTLTKSRERVAVDCAIFADTQDEPKQVYEHLQWLVEYGKRTDGPPIIIKTAGCLGDDVTREDKPDKSGKRIRVAAIPAFTHDGLSDSYGRTKRQCTVEYKINVIERAIRRDVIGLKPRQRIPKGVRVHQYIGFSSDEASRVYRTYDNFQKLSKWSEPHFPLYDHEMTRQDVIDRLGDFGIPHETPRSACTFCPFRSNVEWLWLVKNDQEGFERAVKLDRRLREPGCLAARGMNAGLYLHRSCKPLSEVDFETEIEAKRPTHKQDAFGFDNQCTGMCGL